MKYRKKPVVIEAMDKEQKLKEFIDDVNNDNTPGKCFSIPNDIKEEVWDWLKSCNEQSQ